MRLRLLVLSRYTRLGASSRLRTLQYRPWLENAGLDVTYSHFFDDAYLEGLYGGRRSKMAVFRYFRDRLQALLRKPRPDLIWMEYEALPWLPWVFESAALPTDVPLVSDFDDAVFHRYDRHRSAAVRTLLGAKIDQLMGRSAIVTAGNAYLVERARAAGAVRVELVPTVVQMDLYHLAEQQAGNDELRVGWIGTPQTWRELAQPYFELLRPVLDEYDARFLAVGASLEASEFGRLEIATWSEATEIARTRQMSIGVMPMPDSPWTRGKCGYKLIQYMACGLPVIASPVGVNREIVEHGVNGFLASTKAEWVEALDALLNDKEMRARMGRAGRQKVEEQFSLDIWGPRVATLLKSVVKEGAS